MMSKDSFGHAITGADAAAASGYDHYVSQFLSYGAELRALFDIADDNPDAPLLNAHAAALHLAFEGAEGWAMAAPYIERMNSAANKADKREALFCTAINQWQSKDFHGALATLDDLTIRWPSDLCAIKWGQYHAFNLGDQKTMLRMGERANIAHETTPYAQGMIAFALEQNNRMTEAEDAGLRATEIAIDDAWAHHAVAHVMETEQRPHDGLRWLSHCAHTWEKKGVFIRDHNWWHAALFHLTLGDHDAVLKIYDERLWGAWPEFPQEQIGAVSMLWRLTLRGVDVGDRWRPVVEEARRRAGEHIFAFHDVHYLYALGRGGDAGEAEALVQSMSRYGELQTGRRADFWQGTAVPLAKAILDHVRDRHETAGVKLAALMPDLHLIGGSHAQRHIFTETLDACLDRVSEEAIIQ